MRGGCGVRNSERKDEGMMQKRRGEMEKESEREEEEREERGKENK